MIIKLEFDIDLMRGPFIARTEINTTLFPTVDGSEFAVSGTATSGTWTYTPGPGDPVITAFSVKGGPAFSLFLNTGDMNSGTWSTPVECGPPGRPQPCGLSHIVFYDTALPPPPPPPAVPEPTSLALFGAGLAGLAALARRRRAS